MERVLGLDAQREGDDVTTEIIDLAARPWVGGSVLSAIELTFGAGSRRPRPRRKRF